MTFSWEGRPIRDIEAWAAARGDRMNLVEQRGRDPFSGEWRVTSKDWIPDTFWKTLRMDGTVRYTVLETRAPRSA